jgi:LPS sulfotransferase NodH
MRNVEPFFIVGSVRSGTTLLRNLLRLHPRLECPEETHFFRWAEPFATYRYDLHYRGEVVFERHRGIDGVDHAEFDAVFGTASSRKQLADWYGTEVLKVRSNTNGRWFDKTPQNVYGILLINEAYPDAKFVHVHRNPLNVVASLKQGKIMPAEPLRAAISTWCESAMILAQFRRFQPHKLIELPYEGLAATPEAYLRAVLEFVGEDPEKVAYSQIATHEPRDLSRMVLTECEVRQIKAQTEPYLSFYGYSDNRQHSGPRRPGLRWEPLRKLYFQMFGLLQKRR